MQGEGVIATREFTLFVPGTPTKGKILECFRRQVPDWVNFRLDAKTYMDRKYWKETEQDLTPGWHIKISAQRVDCKVSVDDNAGMNLRDGGVAAQIGRKKRVE